MKTYGSRGGMAPTGEGFDAVEANRDTCSRGARESTCDHLPQSFQSGYSTELPLQLEGSRDICSRRESTSYHLPQSFRSGYSRESRLEPGFRFHPTDDELVSYYLINKVANVHSAYSAIKEVDLNSWEPWDLHEIARTEEPTLYFFTVRNKKYPTGLRANRATKAGYWKPTGNDRPVMSRRTGSLVGMKKTLVFYIGRSPKGLKTNWIMHEYRLGGESVTSPDQECPEWVVCRIFSNFKNAPSLGASVDFSPSTSSVPTGIRASLPPVPILERQSDPDSVIPQMTENAWSIDDSLKNSLDCHGSICGTLDMAETAWSLEDSLEKNLECHNPISVIPDVTETAWRIDDSLENILDSLSQFSVIPEMTEPACSIDDLLDNLRAPWEHQEQPIIMSLFSFCCAVRSLVGGPPDGCAPAIGMAVTTVQAGKASFSVTSVFCQSIVTLEIIGALGFYDDAYFRKRSNGLMSLPPTTCPSSFTASVTKDVARDECAPV